MIKFSPRSQRFCPFVQDTGLVLKRFPARPHRCGPLFENGLERDKCNGGIIRVLSSKLLMYVFLSKTTTVVVYTFFSCTVVERWKLHLSENNTSDPALGAMCCLFILPDACFGSEAVIYLLRLTASIQCSSGFHFVHWHRL